MVVFNGKSITIEKCKKIINKNQRIFLNVFFWKMMRDFKNVNEFVVSDENNNILFQGYLDDVSQILWEFGKNESEQFERST